jgi:hypothetical protein
MPESPINYELINKYDKEDLPYRSTFELGIEKPDHLAGLFLMLRVLVLLPQASCPCSLVLKVLSKFALKLVQAGQ